MTVISRVELHRMIWDQPATTLAKSLGVSSSYLKRVCNDLDVPTPPPGYWAKRKVGKAPQASSLPDPRSGVRQHWVRNNDAYPRESKRIAKPNVYHVKDIQISTKKESHWLIGNARAELTKSLVPEGSLFLWPKKKLLADIVVTQQCLEHALRLGNRIFNTFEQMGCPVAIAPAHERLVRQHPDNREGQASRTYLHRDWIPLRPTVVYIEGIPVGISILEEVTTEKKTYVGRGNYVEISADRPTKHMGPIWEADVTFGTGKIALIAYSPFFGIGWHRTWHQKKFALTPDKLPLVMKEIVNGAQRIEQALVMKGHPFLG